MDIQSTRGQGLPLLLLPNVSPISVAGIFRTLPPMLLFTYWTPNNIMGTSSLEMFATDVGATSGKRKSGRQRPLSPKDDILYCSHFYIT